ncbi:hypothetical protein [Streptomyces sp. NPDC059071]|uniref:hypothetical protein n=1 Tax=unclassified Streptomyces TaxID=2593676 RepID=UPI003633E6D0
MPRKTRHRLAQDAGPTAQLGRPAATDMRGGRPEKHQPPAVGVNGRPLRPVHTIRVSALFL